MSNNITGVIKDAARIVSEYKHDCDLICGRGLEINNDSLPRHSHTIELFMAMQLLAFEYIDQKQDSFLNSNQNNPKTA